MGKHEPMSAKAIANRIKAKGLQKIKYYCEMCKKQCRDDNGFKCHIMSESHQRQALVVAENPEKFVNDFSQQFMDGFMYIVRTRYKFKRVLANTIFQEYIKERDHIHMNGTRWTTLTEFAHWLHEKGLVKAEESERGVMITYIDRDPDTLRRQELDAKRMQRAKEDAERHKIEVEKRGQVLRNILEKEDKESDKTPKAAEIPIETIKMATTSETTPDEVIERPVFKIESVSIKRLAPSGYKPPPKKKKVTKKFICP